MDAILGNGSAICGTGESTHRPLLETGGTPPDPWAAGEADVEGWGEEILCRLGMIFGSLLDITCSSMTGFDLTSGIELKDGGPAMAGVSPVLAVVADVVVGFIVNSLVSRKGMKGGVGVYCPD